MNEIFKLGLKIVAAVVAGGATFVGLSKVFSDSNTKQEESNQTSVDNSSHEDCCTNNCCCSGGITENPQTQPSQKTSGEKVVDCLRKTQDTCSRALNVIQSLTTAVDCIVKAFGTKPMPQNNRGYGYDYNYGYQDKYKDPPGFRRISPYILEYVGENNNNSSYSNNCW